MRKHAEIFFRILSKYSKPQMRIQKRHFNFTVTATAHQNSTPINAKISTKYLFKNLIFNSQIDKI